MQLLVAQGYFSPVKVEVVKAFRAILYEQAKDMDLDMNIIVLFDFMCFYSSHLQNLYTYIYVHECVFVFRTPTS